MGNADSQTTSKKPYFSKEQELYLLKTIRRVGKYHQNTAPLDHLEHELGLHKVTQQSKKCKHE